MPELPDIVVYAEAIERHAGGRRLERVRLASPFVLRSVEPPLSAFDGRDLRRVRRLGKRLVLDFGEAHFIVVHLMIAGRLRWRARGAKVPGRVGLASFDFESGSVILTEAGTKKRASVRAVRGEDALAALDPGGIDVFTSTPTEFADAIGRESHTLKRTLTDPRLLSGIGNAYSDEILHRARLSPLRLTRHLQADEIERLRAAACTVLAEWTSRLRDEVGEGFPEKVTAFRAEMAVHGRFGQPCPVCGSPVQRISYAENECNYCATCQTGGRLLADRAMSRLLRDDWPRSLDEWESHVAERRVEPAAGVPTSGPAPGPRGTKER